MKEALLKKRLVINKEVTIILAVFILTRIFLTVIGTWTNIHTPLGTFRVRQDIFSEKVWLNIWGVWDSSWYINVAKHGYTNNPIELPKASCCGQRNLGFFPLYPVLIKLLTFLVRGYFISGLIISNISLLLSSYILYKLASTKNNKQKALDTAIFLFLFPTSFVLSGALSESLFLALLSLCFLFALKRKWGLVGITGFLLCLTRPLGILVFFPMLYEYLQSINFKLKKTYPSLLYLLLLPLGLLSFAFYTYIHFGDFLAYYHSQKYNFAAEFTNPIKMLLIGFGELKQYFSYITLPISTALIYLTANYKKLRFSYYLMSVVFIIFLLSNGLLVAATFLRQSVVIFPLYIALGAIENRLIKYLAMCFSLSLQGALMVFWSNGINII
jgi:hypothetical protein